MILPVRLFTDKILHTLCDSMVDFSNTQELAESMLSTMYENKGIGLAAPQVGISKQLFIANLENKTKLILVANPKILWYTKETDIQKEGCLSAPGVLVSIERPLGVEFEYYNLSGEKKQMKLEGFDARIFFHEYFHIQGQMITDSISKL